MTTVGVASGKGGAGKTSLAAALAAALAGAGGAPCVVADCDVDAANGAIALGAIVRERKAYFAGPGYRIDADACIRCGLCERACRFDAIRAAGTSARVIVPGLCERCGACVDVCPANAILTYQKQAGELFVSDTRLGIPLAHAELVPGEDTSGKMVRAVRERAVALASGDTVVVVDCPPGIGCPVIASLSGCDLVLVVVEAGASGIRDAERLLELIKSMDRKAVAVINKTGLDPLMDARARSMLAEAGIPSIGEIPFDVALRSMEEAGKTWLSATGSAGRSIAAVLSACIDALNIPPRPGSGTAEQRKENP